MFSPESVPMYHGDLSASNCKFVTVDVSDSLSAEVRSLFRAPVKVTPAPMGVRYLFLYAILLGEVDFSNSYCQSHSVQ